LIEVKEKGLELGSIKNSSSHKDRNITEFLVELGIETLGPAPYSPDCSERFLVDLLSETAQEI
jgi:hypothetical protein